MSAKPKLGVLGRATLYFSIAVLTPVAALLAQQAALGEWPTMLVATATAVGAIVSGLNALRAYFDGSAERQRQNGKEQPKP